MSAARRQLKLGARPLLACAPPNPSLSRNCQKTTVN